jgi:hypothetical protein
MVTEIDMNAFYEGRRTASLPLAANDTVMVVAGRKPGARAAVISLESISPSPTYQIEYGDDGSFDEVALENLKLESLPNQSNDPTA